MKVYFRSLLLTAFSFLAINSYAQQHKTSTKKAPAKKPVAGLSASTAAGQKVYSQYCISCHQADGGGVQHMNPPLIKTTYVLGDKSKIIKIVLNGFSEDVDINGDSYSNTMPSFDMLKDQEIADVLTYVRNSFTNKASAVKISEVTPLRGKK
jgi:mono/diheme cytochrome c family protein